MTNLFSNETPAIDNCITSSSGSALEAGSCGWFGLGVGFIKSWSSDGGCLLYCDGTGCRESTRCRPLWGRTEFLARRISLQQSSSCQQYLLESSLEQYNRGLENLSRDNRTVAVCCIVTARAAENRLAAGPCGAKQNFLRRVSVCNSPLFVFNTYLNRTLSNWVRFLHISRYFHLLGPAGLPCISSSSVGM